MVQKSAHVAWKLLYQYANSANSEPNTLNFNLLTQKLNYYDDCLFSSHLFWNVTSCNLQPKIGFILLEIIYARYQARFHKN